MISIKVIEPKKKNKKKFLDPIDCWGADHGTIFQEYVEGRPTKNYYIGCGRSENLINIWWDDDEYEGKVPGWKLSSDSQASLTEFVPAVKFLKIKATVKIELEI